MHVPTLIATNLKPSLTIYKHRSQPLRFTKFGDRNLEEAYSRYFVVVGKRHDEVRADL